MRGALSPGRTRAEVNWLHSEVGCAPSQEEPLAESHSGSGEPGSDANPCRCGYGKAPPPTGLGQVGSVGGKRPSASL